MHASAVRLDDVRYQRESKSGARDFAVLRNRRPIEFLEDAGLLFLRNADAIVGNMNPGIAVFGKQPEVDFSKARNRMNPRRNRYRALDSAIEATG